MENLKKYFLVWFTTTQLSLQIAFENRLAALFFISAKFLRFGFFIIFLSVLLNRTGTVGSFTREAMFTFFLVFNLYDLLGQLLFRGIYWFRQQVVSGEFDFRLIKPLNPLFQVLTRQTDILDLPLLFTVVIFLIKLHPHVPFSLLLNFLVVSLGALLLITAIHILVAALGVVTTEVDHTIMIYRDLSIMARVPVDIYTPVIRGFLTYLIPIAVAFTFPAKALLGILQPFEAVFSLLVGLASFVLSVLIWKQALKQYSSASS